MKKTERKGERLLVVASTPLDHRSESARGPRLP